MLFADHETLHLSSPFGVSITTELSELSIHLWRRFSLPSILFLAIFLASYLSVCALPQEYMYHDPRLQSFQPTIFWSAPILKAGFRLSIPSLDVSVNLVHEILSQTQLPSTLHRLGCIKQFMTVCQQTRQGECAAVERICLPDKQK